MKKTAPKVKVSTAQFAPTGRAAIAPVRRPHWRSRRARQALADPDPDRPAPACTQVGVQKRKKNQKAKLPKELAEGRPDVEKRLQQKWASAPPAAPEIAPHARGLRLCATVLQLGLLVLHASPPVVLLLSCVCGLMLSWARTCTAEGGI